jgi:hypothetical protein
MIAPQLQYPTTCLSSAISSHLTAAIPHWPEDPFNCCRTTTKFESWNTGDVVFLSLPDAGFAL